MKQRNQAGWTSTLCVDIKKAQNQLKIYSVHEAERKQTGWTSTLWVNIKKENQLKIYSAHETERK